MENLKIRKEGLVALARLGRGDKPVSNSHLGRIKRCILNRPEFRGDERFLWFGEEVHRRILEPHEPPASDWVFTEAEYLQIETMVASFEACPEHMEHLIDSEKEIMVESIIDNVPIRGKLDIKKHSLGVDLKTTSCNTYATFMSSAKKYDYFRQAWIYTQIADLKEFKFIALSKKSPFEVFELDTGKFKNLMEMAEQETRYLLDVYKNYCNIK